MRGDVITKIENHEISTVAKLKYYLYKYNPGEKVKITYIRDGKTKTTTVELAKSEQICKTIYFFCKGDNKVFQYMKIIDKIIIGGIYDI